MEPRQEDNDMATTFNDTKGNNWNASITVGALRRVLAQTEIDLTRLFDDEKAEPVQKLLANPIVIADVVFAVVEPQATAKGIDAAAFGELLEGQALAEATDALLDALAVFFSARQAEMGQAFAKVVANYRKAAATVWGRAVNMVEAVDPTAAAMEAFDRELAKHGGRVNSGP